MNLMDFISFKEEINLHQQENASVFMDNMDIVF